MTNDSHIKYNSKGDAVAFVGPDAVAVFRAASIMSGLGLLAKGIKPGSAWTITKALAAAGQITGK